MKWKGARLGAWPYQCGTGRASPPLSAYCSPPGRIRFQNCEASGGHPTQTSHQTVFEIVPQTLAPTQLLTTQMNKRAAESQFCSPLVCWVHPEAQSPSSTPLPAWKRERDPPHNKKTVFDEDPKLGQGSGSSPATYQLLVTLENLPNCSESCLLPSRCRGTFFQRKPPLAWPRDFQAPPLM